MEKMKKFNLLPKGAKGQNFGLFPLQGGGSGKDADGKGHDRQHERLGNEASTQSAGQMALAKCDGPWTVGRHLVNPEEVIAEGGFGVVFLVKVINKNVYYIVKGRQFQFSCCYKNFMNQNFLLSLRGYK